MASGKIAPDSAGGGRRVTYQVGLISTAPWARAQLELKKALEAFAKRAEAEADGNLPLSGRGNARRQYSRLL